MIRCNLTRVLTCLDFNLEAILSAESEEELEEVIQGLKKTGEHCDHSIIGQVIQDLPVSAPTVQEKAIKYFEQNTFQIQMQVHDNLAAFGNKMVE